MLVGLQLSQILKRGSLHAFPFLPLVLSFRKGAFGDRQNEFSSVQFSSVAQLCATLCDPMDCTTPGFSVQYQLPELPQTHAHEVCDAIQPSHPLLSPLLLPSAFPSIRVFSNEAKWVKVVKRYKLSVITWISPKGVIYSTVIIANSIVLFIWRLLRVDL